MKRVLLAFQFLTIVPLRVTGDVTEKDLGNSTAFFPLVGAFQGVLVAVPVFFLMKILPPEIVAGLAILLSVAGNGGFDLDGLADTADALAVKASGDTEADRTKKLSVMKDSAIGAMGVIALIMTVLMKFVLMHRLLTDFSVLSAGAIFFLAPVFSKWIPVPAMYHSVSARRDGLGRIFIEHTKSAGVIISTGLTVALLLLVSALDLVSVSFLSGIASCILFMAALYFFSLLTVHFFVKRFGGLTGDHFGALTEVSENLFLLTAYLWLPRSIS